MSRGRGSSLGHNVLLDGGGSLGALAAGLPILLQHHLALSVLSSYRIVFFGLSGLCLIVAALYSLLSPAVEIADSSLSAWMSPSISSDSKRIVAKITALFSLDAFGGGFLTDALVAYWFFRRFGIAEHDLGLVFFAVHILNAGSHLGAAWLARRIGLEHDGVHSSSIQSFPHGCALCPFAQVGSLALPVSRSFSGNGCSHAAVLCGCAREAQ